jgi:uncharacterized DUF497 family protein
MSGFSAFAICGPTTRAASTASTLFHWDDENRTKLTSHDPDAKDDADDVEWLFELGDPDIFDYPTRGGRCIALGFVPDERFVLVVFEYDAKTPWVRVVSAMKRTTSAGGKSTRRPRSASRSHVPERDEDRIDPDARPFAGVDWDRLPRRTFELDPVLVEAIHLRRQLKQLTLRVGVDQIEEARRVAKRTGTKYQAVLRRWLAEGASRARVRRRSAK